MKIAVVTAPGAVELRDEPRPELGADDVLVEVGACGLCTMERRLFAGEKQMYPVAPGHEAAGHVVEVGSGVDGLPGVPAVGDRVAVDLLTRCGACNACRRGHSALCQRPQSDKLHDGTVSVGAGLAEFVRVPAKQAWAVGDAPMAHASMGEPVACVAHSLRRSGLHAWDRVAIIGAGYMGRLHLALSRVAGASPIGLIDVSDQRLQEARDAGAAWTATPETAVAAGGEQDVVFVTAGTPGAVELALQLCDDGGTVVLYGAFPKDLFASVGPDAIHHHEHSIVGVYSQEPEDWRTAAGLIRSGAIAADLDALVTASYSLTDVNEAFELATNNPVFRVLVGPNA